MTADDTPRLAQFLAVIAEAFNEPVSELRAEAYLIALDDISIDALESVGKRALNLQYFPRPADLRRLVEGTPEQESELAWLSVLSEVRRVGYTGQPLLSAASAETVRLMWGTWAHLCATLPGDGIELITWGKRFRSAYVATTERLARPEFISRDEAREFWNGFARPAALDRPKE